jgi:phage terminase small subunit
MLVMPALRNLQTADRIALITFCTRFHLYIHAYALILQGRGLTLTQIAAIESVVIAAQFLMEIPTAGR